MCITHINTKSPRFWLLALLGTYQVILGTPDHWGGMITASAGSLLLFLSIEEHLVHHIQELIFRLPMPRQLISDIVILSPTFALNSMI